MAGSEQRWKAGAFETVAGPALSEAESEKPAGQSGLPALPDFAQVQHVSGESGPALLAVSET